MHHRQLRPSTSKPFSAILMAVELQRPEKEDFPIGPTVPMLAL
jgi:hypothetical protein